MEATAWMMTLFSEQKTEGDPQDLITWTAGHSQVHYCIWQIEKCPETNRLHIQAYLELTHKRGLAWLKLNLSETAHWEIRRGSQQKAIEYCSKEETRWLGPFTVGEKKAQGSRTDLAAVLDLVKTGAGYMDILEMNPSAAIRYAGNIKSVINLYQKDRSHPPVVIWLHGPSGSGKTRYVFAHHDRTQIYMKDSSMWWDGYDPKVHKVVLFDEFELTDFGRSEVLRITDRYPCRRQVKGGYVSISPDYVYFTMNDNPTGWMCNAMKRRTHAIVYCQLGLDIVVPKREERVYELIE